MNVLRLTATFYRNDDLINTTYNIVICIWIDVSILLEKKNMLVLDRQSSYFNVHIGFCCIH